MSIKSFIAQGTDNHNKDTGYQPWPQILDQSGSEWKWQTLWRITKNMNLTITAIKSFIAQAIDYHRKDTGSWPWPQILDLGGSEWKWQTLQLITILQKLWP